MTDELGNNAMFYESRSQKHTRSVRTVRETGPRRGLAVWAALGLFSILLPSLTVGCFGTPNQPATAEVSPPDQLWEQAELARVAGRHAEAAELYATFHRFHYRDPRAAEALLDAGTEFRRAGNIDRARDHLITAAQKGDPRIAPHAWLQLGYLERAEGQFAAAAMRFQDAAQSAMEIETRAEALLEAGLSMQRAGAFAEAARPLNACVQLRSQAPKHAEEAERALRQPPFFTVQIGVFKARERAENLMKKLANSNLEATMDMRPSETGAVFRVTSGQFARRPEAERHAQRIKALGHEAWIQP